MILLCVGSPLFTCACQKECRCSSEQSGQAEISHEELMGKAQPCIQLSPERFHTLNLFFFLFSLAIEARAASEPRLPAHARPPTPTLPPTTPSWPRTSRAPAVWSADPRPAVSPCAPGSLRRAPSHGPKPAVGLPWDLFCVTLVSFGGSLKAILNPWVTQDLPLVVSDRHCGLGLVIKARIFLR